MGVDGEVGGESVDVVTSKNVESYTRGEVFVGIQRDFVGPFARVGDFRVDIRGGGCGWSVDGDGEGKEQRERESNDIESGPDVGRCGWYFDCILARHFLAH